MQYLHYASYGSNLHPVRFTERIPSGVHLGQGFLPNCSLGFHKRSNVDGSGKCSIANTGSGVHIAVYRIDAADKPRLDAIEGRGDGYADKTIELADFGECFTYVAEPSHIERNLLPMDWYKAMVVLGCEFNEFPSDYVDRIRLTAAEMDLDEERSTREWECVGRIQSADKV